MGHQSGPFSGSDENGFLPQRKSQLFCLILFQGDKDHVGLGTILFHSKVLDVTQAFGKHLCILMISGKAGNIVFQGVQSGGGDNTGLTHTSPDHFAPFSGFGDEFDRPA